MLIIGLVVGVVVSLLQAVTQIQEQTLTFVPKIAAMVAAAIVLMPWIGQRLIEYSPRCSRRGSCRDVRVDADLHAMTSPIRIAFDASRSCSSPMLDDVAQLRPGVRAGRSSGWPG